MRKAMAVFWGAIFVFSILTGIAQAADKLGYVDLSKLFSDYSKTKEYDKLLTSKGDAYNTEREKKVNEIKQFQDKINLLSEKEKTAKTTELESKVNALQEFDRQRQTDLRKEQDEKMKEILKDIEDAVKQYSEKEGYTMVFNDRVLVYESKGLDITAKVMAILDKGSKK